MCHAETQRRRVRRVFDGLVSAVPAPLRGTFSDQRLAGIGCVTQRRRVFDGSVSAVPAPLRGTFFPNE